MRRPHGEAARIHLAGGAGRGGGAGHRHGRRHQGRQRKRRQRAAPARQDLRALGSGEPRHRAARGAGLAERRPIEWHGGDGRAGVGVARAGFRHARPRPAAPGYRSAPGRSGACVGGVGRLPGPSHGAGGDGRRGVRPAARGFTLLELIVALAVFGLVSVLAYGGLRTVLEARAATDAMATRLAEIQTAVHLMGRDIEQIVTRPIRDEYGDTQPALQSASVGRMRLEFTRTGMTNPTDLPRPALRRIGYGLEEETLQRYSWRALDRPPEAEVDVEPLLEGVVEFGLRFLDAEANWHDDWPPLTGMGQEPRLLPVAVELTLELEDQGTLTRLFGVRR
ncbi:type II secretion system minor pseudopilin GspJ [Ectothiorhodospiraceae bacterium 2226]|nr:type II secretion system minor pseudopilin GspJ [Ectothiorhodospiraceae bacterium 2226]